MIKLYNFDELRPEEILNRDIRAEKNVEDVVDGIIADVRARGDAALKDYALKFDGAAIENLQVTQEEIDEAFANMDPYFLETLREAAANIEAFHRQQVHKNFVMNDKCAAGTGRFLEIMADRLGISQQQMADLARSGEPTKISSMCTVFAESEVISLIGRGEPRENIARGVIDSVVSRVATMAGQAAGAPYYLTGGLCENAYVVERLAALLGSPVTTSPQARFAGAIGAAIRAQALN